MATIADRGFRPASIVALGWAAIAGGAMWSVKALAVLATGEQPSMLFELPLLLFPLGLLGLSARLDGAGGRAGRIGAVLATGALASGVVAVVIFLADPDADGLAPGLAISGSALGTVAALVVLGVASRRAHLFGERFRSVPLWLGIATPPLVMFIGGLLAAIHERLLEVPLVIVALGWMWLGVLITRGEPAQAVR